MREGGPPGRYEKYALVLDYAERAKSVTVRGRNGPMITAIGEEKLLLLEILGKDGMSFEPSERIFIGREGRTKVETVFGKIPYGRISLAAKNRLPEIVERIVARTEARFVRYLNRAEALTYRVHALELIPGVGRKYVKAMIAERERQEFASFEDIETRIGLKNPVARIAERILFELAESPRMSIFVKR